MKRIFALVCLTGTTLGRAADLHLAVETFHSNMRAASTHTQGYWSERRVTYDNAPGAGISGLYSLSENVAFGLGLGYVRYYQSQERVMDRTSTQLFARSLWLRRDAFEVYGKAGLSQQQLHADQRKSSGFHSSYAPLFNYDLGIGGALNFGRSSFGLEYRYADSLSRGRASVTYPYLILKSPGGSPQRAKTQLKDIAIRTHELALTANVAL